MCSLRVCVSVCVSCPWPGLNVSQLIKASLDYVLHPEGS